MNALIGHTGFVGGNLLRQAKFEGLYNSKNIESIAGESFELVVCAGAPAEKWKANKDPEGDEKAIERLTSALGQMKSKKVVLISTVDVYPAPRGVDEATSIDPASSSPYGRHRYELEMFLAERFDTLIVRLPGLYGPGIKKNVIFDFLHNNRVEAIHADGVFQFYGLERLWTDVQIAIEAGLSVVNFAVEPTRVGEVAKVGFGMEFENRPAGAAPATYDFHSRHAAKFGGSGAYLQSKAQVLEGIARFVKEQRG